MVGALALVGSSVVDSHTSPCLCLEALPSSSLNHKSGGDLVSQRSSAARKHLLSSSFVDSGHELKLLVKAKKSRKPPKHRSLVIVNELAGQYEDSFEDVKTKRGNVVHDSVALDQIIDCVKDLSAITELVLLYVIYFKQLLNYFTYKAVRTVLNQLYEMNPTQYRWFYDFVVTNKPGDGRRFIRSLGKEKQDLAERVMITRLHLYGKWVKKCNHAEIYKEISEQNLELMRERLIETVIWPSDDTNTEKIG
ncbi:chaperonin-like RbcX protein 2, chloroplastic isoform X1 [Diospyros lotus]|nr:chaperonin-like RbcX protein 2, chloroplastic isoform X1 [Diospyros lotus]